MKIHLKNGRVIDPASGMDAIQDIYLAAGHIQAVGSVPADFHANQVIDAAGLVVCPGLVDLSLRLREPGLEHIAGLESEMRAAAARLRPRRRAALMARVAVPIVPPTSKGLLSTQSA